MRGGGLRVRAFGGLRRHENDDDGRYVRWEDVRYDVLWDRLYYMGDTRKIAGVLEYLDRVATTEQREVLKFELLLLV